MADQAEPRPASRPFDERTERIETAIYGGIDEWDVRLTMFTGKDAVTPERLHEALPRLIQGGVCIGVEVRRVNRVET